MVVVDVLVSVGDVVGGVVLVVVGDVVGRKRLSALEDR